MMTEPLAWLLYPGVDGSPAVLLVEIPAPRRGPGLLLGRFHYALLESAAEVAEAEAAVAGGLERWSAFSTALGRRPSRTSGRAYHLATPEFDPAASPGFPWLMTLRVPDALAPGLLADDPDALYRRAYTVEAAWRAEEMTAIIETITAPLRRQGVRPAGAAALSRRPGSA